MKCTNCGLELPPGSKFCERCGSRLQEETNQNGNQVTGRCRICGAELKAGYAFCERCGEPVSASCSDPSRTAPLPQTGQPGKKKWVVPVVAGLLTLTLVGAGAFVILWNSAKTNETESVNEDTVAEANDNEEETNEIESTDTTDPVEEETQTEPPLFSKRIWDYDGTIYTSYAMDNTNWTSLTEDYHDTFIAYHNNIYLRRANIENSDTRELVCEDMNGNDTVIAQDVNPLYGLVIYKDYLYYVALDNNMQSEGKVVDLSDLSVADSEDYQIKAADANTWILCGIKGEEGGQLFMCDPGFENINKLDITTDTFMGIYDDKIYFQTQEDGKYHVQTYDVSSGDIASVLEDLDEPAVLSGSDLFYAEKTGNGTTLHRMEVGANGKVYEYSLKDIDVYMRGSFYEADNKVYLTRFLQGKEENNAEMIALDLQSGEYESIGMWTNTEIQNTQVQSTANARYQAYAEKIKEEEKKYGSVKIENDSYACMTGICFIDLVDFAGHGEEQLLLVHQNSNRECGYEIWSWENGQMVLLETDDLFATDGGVRTVIYSKKEGKTYLVTGAMDDFEEYYFHGYSGSSFGKAYEIVRDEELNGDEWNEFYTVNGQNVSESTYDDAYTEWLANTTEYNLSYDCAQVLQLMENVKERLNGK